MKSILKSAVRQFCLTSILSLFFVQTGFAGAYEFSYSGRLVDNEGKPLAGPVALKISFHHSESGTTSVLDVTNGIDNVTLKDGVFQVVMSLDGSDFQRVFPNVNQAVYIEVTDLTNAPTSPYGRQRFTILPYAGKVPVDSSQFSWSADGKLQLVGGGSADSTTVATLTNKTIDAASNTITNISNSSISATAAIADSKLATIATAGKVSGAAITSGTIAGTTAVSTSGAISTTGKVGVGAAAGTSQMEVKGGGATSATSSLNVMDSAGTSRLFVRDDGNVGIGTTSPSSRLDVVQSGITAGIRLTGGTNPQLRLEGATALTKLQLCDSCSGGLNDSGNGIGLFGTENAYPFAIYTNNLERVRIASNGNVGIGTKAPINTLSASPVQYSTGTASQSTTTVTGVGTTWTSAMVGSQLVFANGTSAGTITAFGSATSLTVSVSQTVTSQAYSIHYPGLNVSSTGNLGIGTTAPGAKLHIATNNSRVTAPTYPGSIIVEDVPGSLYFESKHLFDVTSKCNLRRLRPFGLG